MAAKPNYLPRYHEIYFQRVRRLKERVKGLRAALSQEDFQRHETVKLAARVRRAELEILEDPNRPEYLLRDELRKFRRYKRGLSRYRIIFCFSNDPPIVVFLYLNTEDSLRKEGARSDPYEEFKALLRRGAVSGDPADPRLRKWLESAG